MLSTYNNFIAVIIITFSLPLISDETHNVNIPYQTTSHELHKPILYTPWREQYVETSSHKKNEECIFCLIRDGKDKTNFVLGRFEHNMVMLNLYPYSRGHLLIVPYQHVTSLSELSTESHNELMRLMVQCTEILPKAIGADGINVGINIGKAGQASIPDHIHVQILPRYDNEPWGYILLLAETRMVYWDLHKLFNELLPYFQQ